MMSKWGLVCSGSGCRQALRHECRSASKPLSMIITVFVNCAGFDHPESMSSTSKTLGMGCTSSFDSRHAQTSVRDAALLCIA